MNRLTLLIFGLASLMISGCQSVDDDRIPNYPVNLILGDAGTWNSFGVSGFGSNRRFILQDGVREPRNFPYAQTSSTGFGGVLLISGMDPYTGETDVPLAYDLACPVEKERIIKIRIDTDSYTAVCDVCTSTFDVATAGGAPISGPASTMPCAMRRYRCVATPNGGFIITN